MSGTSGWVTTNRIWGLRRFRVERLADLLDLFEFGD